MSQKKNSICDATIPSKFYEPLPKLTKKHGYERKSHPIHQNPDTKLTHSMGLKATKSSARVNRAVENGCKIYQIIDIYYIT